MRRVFPQPGGNPLSDVWRGNSEVGTLSRDSDFLLVAGVTASVSSDCSVTVSYWLENIFIVSPEGKNAKISALTLCFDVIQVAQGFDP